MPNWCENDLFVSGKPEEIHNFLAFARGSEAGCLLDFNKFIPYPDEYRKLDEAAELWDKEHPNDRSRRPKDGFNSGGYYWCVANWGTKWQAAEFSIEDDTSQEFGLVTIHFNTAWAPPLPIILKVSECFPALEFDLRYFECGAAFNGQYRCQGGEVLCNRQADYFGSRGG